MIIMIYNKCLIYIYYYYYNMETAQHLLSVVSDIGFVVFPLLGYIHQYMKILKLKSSEGFSKMVSFILIFAFDVRVFFWIGERFELAVLMNAILGLIMQLLLLHACVKYSKKKNGNKIVSSYFNVYEFWNWPYYMDYFYFVSFFTVALSFISNVIGYDNKSYVFFLGSLTAGIEAFLGVPQMLEIFRTKNVETISYLLVSSWFCGDVFKLIYYLAKNSPLQLIFCDVFQLIVDCVIVWQIWFYSKHNKQSNNKNANTNVNRSITTTTTTSMVNKI